jgi:hypothetical protein
MLDNNKFSTERKNNPNTKKAKKKYRDSNKEKIKEYNKNYNQQLYGHLFFATQNQLNSYLELI